MESKFVLSRCGDDLFSIVVDSPADAQALATQLRTNGTWVEVIPGIDSVVVRFDAARQDGHDAERAIRVVLAMEITVAPDAGPLIEIPVVYGGEFGSDLEALTAQTGLSADEIIALHTGSEYTVDMVGFTPGFAFIGGLDNRLSVPRREEPRQRVAAGSIGIADGRTGIYALASPGGWNIIGRTSSTLFDADAEDPFVLKAGMRVRFKAL